MQQSQQMVPVMPSFPPTNITTEQIQKVSPLLSPLFLHLYMVGLSHESVPLRKNDTLELGLARLGESTYGFKWRS